MLRGFTHQLNSSHLNPGDLQLNVDSLHLSFGGVTALYDISLEVFQSEIMAIIGPNGAGKTSLLNCISGLGEHEINRLKPHQISRLGIARSFQNIELFRHMTVMENMMAGAHVHMRSNLISCMLYWGPAQREQIEFRRFIEDIIDLLEIESIRDQPVGSLAR
jgi:branched-chain amino acid transport system ATP-binding protein